MVSDGIRWYPTIVLLSVTCAQGAVKGTLGMVQGWAVRMGGGRESIIIF